ncbi:hypothetical protein GY45DRAFT_183448 [Cubamyces sp. BRFM 1775]|nr:hypothetical protein GY45DRAFT_183448 [Cubamyces sp. BRFM 1775]
MQDGRAPSACQSRLITCQYDRSGSILQASSESLWAPHDDECKLLDRSSQPPLTRCVTRALTSGFWRRDALFLIPLTVQATMRVARHSVRKSSTHRPCIQMNVVVGFPFAKIDSEARCFRTTCARRNHIVCSMHPDTAAPASTRLHGLKPQRGVRGIPRDEAKVTTDRRAPSYVKHSRG